MTDSVLSPADAAVVAPLIETYASWLMESGAWYASNMADEPEPWIRLRKVALLQAFEHFDPLITLLVAARAETAELQIQYDALDKAGAHVERVLREKLAARTREWDSYREECRAVQQVIHETRTDAMRYGGLVLTECARFCGGLETAMAEAALRAAGGEG